MLARQRILLLSFLVLQTFSYHISADTSYPIQTYPYLYRSGYFLERGDTGIAIADGADAIFYNPAGIAVGNGIFKKVVIASPLVEISKDTRDVAKQIALQNSDPTDTLRQHEGSAQHAAISNFTGIILRKVAFGAFVSSQTTVLLAKNPHAGGFENVSARALADGGLTFTLAETFFAKSLFWGLTAKYIDRTEGALDANATDANQVSQVKKNSSGALTGTAMGADFGLMYRGDGRSPLSIGCTVQDIGKTKFIETKKSTGTTTLLPMQPIKQTINCGIAVEPGTRLSKFRLLVDYRDIANSYKQSGFKRIHLGGELSVRDFVGFAAGLNQGYPTVGMYVDARFVRLDLGGYGEELGEKAGSREDLRYFVKLSVGL